MRDNPQLSALLSDRPQSGQLWPVSSGRTASDGRRNGQPPATAYLGATGIPRRPGSPSRPRPRRRPARQSSSGWSTGRPPGLRHGHPTGDRPRHGASGSMGAELRRAARACVDPRRRALAHARVPETREAPVTRYVVHPSSRATPLKRSQIASASSLMRHHLSSIATSGSPVAKEGRTTASTLPTGEKWGIGILRFFSTIRPGKVSVSAATVHGSRCSPHGDARLRQSPRPYPPVLAR